MRSARRIVDAALALEAEGLDPDEAFEAACAKVAGVSSGARDLARRTLAALARRGGRVETALPDRDARGRFRRPALITYGPLPGREHA